MLVFIDESGDAGFRVGEGSSPAFVVAMVIFGFNDDADDTEKAIKAVKQQLGLQNEFKFNKLRNDWKDEFFEAVKGCPFKVRAIVVRKDVIYSPHLRSEKDNFYRFFVRIMMTNDGNILDNAKVVLDGSGDREFKKQFRTYLKKHSGDRIRTFRFSNSKNDLLVQLADMCAGAIARSYNPDRKDASRWRKMLAPRISDVWEFR